MERGVGEAGGSEVWVLDEAGVRLNDASYEEGVVGVDCATEAEGGVDPTQVPAVSLSCSGIREREMGS